MTTGVAGAPCNEQSGNSVSCSRIGQCGEEEEQSGLRGYSCKDDRIDAQYFSSPSRLTFPRPQTSPCLFLAAVEESTMCAKLSQFWSRDEGQDIAEYAVVLAVILVLVVGTIRLIGSNANNVFSQTASSIQ